MLILICKDLHLIIFSTLPESSVKSVVTIFKQLAEVVKNTGDVITKIARNKTENQNILQAGEFVRNQIHKKVLLSRQILAQRPGIVWS